MKKWFGQVDESDLEIWKMRRGKDFYQMILTLGYACLTLMKYKWKKIILKKNDFFSMFDYIMKNIKKNQI